MRHDQTAICTILLIAVNVGIFFLFDLTGHSDDTLFFLEHGAMYEPYVVEGKEYYRLVSSMFLHFGIDHLLNNMVMLGALGWNLELLVGKVRFLMIYFVGGIGGNIVSLLFNQAVGNNIVSAGASGAVFALMGALFCAVIQNRGHIGRLSGRGMLYMVALSLYFSAAASGVDNAAHIGGLIFGFLLQAVMGMPHRGGEKDHES